jgi:adenylate cyclase
VEVALGWWRALGLPDPQLAGAILGPAHVAMAQTVAALGSFVGEATLRDLLRVFGSSTQQIANAGVNALRVGFEQPLRQAGTADAEVSRAYDVVVAVLPAIAEMFDTLMRHNIVASVYEQVAVSEDGAVQTLQSIVFVDVVDYTRLTQQIDPARLAVVLSAFEARAADVALEHGGRLVKLLGDGAMLSFGRRADAIAAARAAVRDAPDLPPRRAGVATGAVLTRQGDFYGDVVNLAARLSGVVEGGEVAVDTSAPVADGEAVEPVVLKGMTERVAYFRVR